MANTFTLISSNTLTSRTATISASAIPATYTDLQILLSLRFYGSGGATSGDLTFRLNSLSTSIYSYRYVQGNGASATSSSTSGNTQFNIPNACCSDTATANTFSNISIYIPNYAAAINKAIFVDAAQETNATTAYRNANALLLSSTAAIDSISMTGPYSGWETGSSISIYGIKKS